MVEGLSIIGVEHFFEQYYSANPFSDSFLNANVMELPLKSFDFQRLKNATDKSSTAKAPPGFQVQIPPKSLELDQIEPILVPASGVQARLEG